MPDITDHGVIVVTRKELETVGVKLCIIDDDNTVIETHRIKWKDEFNDDDIIVEGSFPYD